LGKAPPERNWIMKKEKNIIAFLGKGTEFNGALTFDGGIRMDGRLKGEIKGGDSLIIGEEGTVEAEIHVPWVIIMGEVRGNIFSEKKVVIHSKGMVHGDIKTPSLVIDDGGIFNGRCLMQDVEQMDEEKVIMISSQKTM
jgi:cytoskeletal protein CcmA (bactofilin family)